MVEGEWKKEGRWGRRTIKQGRTKEEGGMEEGPRVGGGTVRDGVAVGEERTVVELGTVQEKEIRL